jgi:endo-1,4-beta-xylanase
MQNKKWTRRQVVGSLAIMPLAVNAGVSNFSNILQATTKSVRCKLFNSNGDPFDVNKMDRFHICDLSSRPFRIDPEFAPGEMVFRPVSTPFRISLPVKVPGFGEIFLYADNRGAGYTAKSLEKTETLFLNYEFAADRLATIHKLTEECRNSGIKLTSGTLKRITSAERSFEQARQASGDDKAVTKWTMESLRESLYAGEMIVVERAQQLIQEKGARPGFMFGCNAFRFRDYGSPYSKLFESLFNYATLPFYMGGIEKVQGQCDYSQVDTILEALQNTNIIKKGHPLIFLVPDATPEWAKYISFEETKEICLSYVRNSILKYRGRFNIWDVINEAHVQPDTENGEEMVPGLTVEQNIELSSAAVRSAREADPTCFRIINNTGTWSDYYMGRKPLPWQQNVYDYLKMLEDAGCEYEAIGLQYYHSGRDLLEFERDVERFSHFKKPLHITELQIPSSSEDIPGNEWWGGGIGGSGILWHGEEFTETIQADWVESVYTILYSKPYVDAITWWDMADPAFVPHGGLVNEDLSPKESYYRLKNLLENWKFSV